MWVSSLSLDLRTRLCLRRSSPELGVKARLTGVNNDNNEQLVSQLSTRGGEISRSAGPAVTIPPTHHVVLLGVALLVQQQGRHVPLVLVQLSDILLLQVDNA